MTIQFVEYVWHKRFIDILLAFQIKRNLEVCINDYVYEHTLTEKNASCGISWEECEYVLLRTMAWKPMPTFQLISTGGFLCSH